MRKGAYCTMSSIKFKNDVCLIGVGTMGRQMLEKLVEGGFSVSAFDPVPAAQALIVSKGAVLCESAAEAARTAPVVIFSLPMPKHVFTTVEAIYDALTPEHVLVDTSTVSPQTSRSCAKRVAEKGAGYIDAPVLGRPTAVGKWLLPAGGTAENIQRVQPYLRTFAREVVRVGDSGAGNAFKLLNQLMFSVINGISAEVMALTDVLGIDRKVFFDVISQSGAATVSGLFKETAVRMVSDHYDEPNFTVELLCKDAGLGIEMAKEAGVSPLIAGFVQSINENAKGVGLAKQDTSAITKVFRGYFSKMD